MTMSLFASLNTSHSAEGMCIFAVNILSFSLMRTSRDGRYGLYLDDTLIDGSSACCPTFENEPLCSAGPKKGGNVSFECVGLEVWAVGPT